MKATDEPIVVEQLFDVPLTEVWAAISELHQMRQWFFPNIKAFEPREGFETKFTVENEGRIFPHVWKVTKVAPMSVLAYNWRYEGYEGDSMVIFEIFEQNHQTRLSLTHKVMESFQSGIPEFSRESCMAGLNYFINQELKKYLENKNTKR
jgi:uncharacterized protein YndB with AHSA1/START domain